MYSGEESYANIKAIPSEFTIWQNGFSIRGVLQIIWELPDREFHDIIIHIVPFPDIYIFLSHDFKPVFFVEM